MAQWQTDEAEQNFADMIGAAERKGPQVVMRDKDPVAVVLSPDDYRLLVRQADANFAHPLALSPFGPEDGPGGHEPVRAHLNDHRPVVQPDRQPS